MSLNLGLINLLPSVTPGNATNGSQPLGEASGEGFTGLLQGLLSQLKAPGPKPELSETSPALAASPIEEATPETPLHEKETDPHALDEALTALVASLLAAPQPLPLQTAPQAAAQTASGSTGQAITGISPYTKSTEAAVGSSLLQASPVFETPSALQAEGQTNQTLTDLADEPLELASPENNPLNALNPVTDPLISVAKQSGLSPLNAAQQAVKPLSVESFLEDGAEFAAKALENKTNAPTSLQTDLTAKAPPAQVLEATALQAAKATLPAPNGIVSDIKSQGDKNKLEKSKLDKALAQDTLSSAKPVSDELLTNSALPTPPEVVPPVVSPQAGDFKAVAGVEGFQSQPAGASGSSVHQQLSQQVAKEVSYSVQNGQPSAQLHLKPEALGQVRVNLNTQADGTLHARFVVETPEALEQLHQQSRELQDTLRQQGIELKQVQFVLAGAQNAENQPSFNQNNSQQQAQQQGAGQQNQQNLSGQEQNHTARQFFQAYQQQQQGQSHRGFLSPAALQINPLNPTSPLLEESSLPSLSRNQQGRISLHV